MLLTGLPAQAEIYRCEQAGRTVFTDRPCHAGAEALEVRAPNLIDTRAGAELARAYDERIARGKRTRDAAFGLTQDDYTRERSEKDRLRSARVRGKVVKGMKPSDVRYVLGEPDEVTRSQDGKGERERWRYTRELGVERTVSFVDGTVSSVRSSKGKKKG